MWLNIISKNAVVAYYKQICANCSMNINGESCLSYSHPPHPFLSFLYPYRTIISFPPLSVQWRKLPLCPTDSTLANTQLPPVQTPENYFAQQRIQKCFPTCGPTTDAAGCFFFLCYEWNVYLSRFWYCSSFYHHVFSQLTDSKNGSCEILLRLRHGCTHFQRNLVPPQNSSCHLGDMNQFPYWEVTVHKL